MTAPFNKTPKTHIAQDPSIRNLLSRMPEEVAESFTETQLTHLMLSIGTRNWGKHKIDLRGTARIPFYRWRFYYVLLAGRNYRELSRREIYLSALATAVVMSLALVICSLLGILVLYLIKSALGIDIFPNFSFGVWGKFKEIFGF